MIDRLPLLSPIGFRLARLCDATDTVHLAQSCRVLAEWVHAFKGELVPWTNMAAFFQRASLNHMRRVMATDAIARRVMHTTYAAATAMVPLLFGETRKAQWVAEEFGDLLHVAQRGDWTCTVGREMIRYLFASGRHEDALSEIEAGTICVPWSDVFEFAERSPPACYRTVMRIARDACKVATIRVHRNHPRLTFDTGLV